MLQSTNGFLDLVGRTEQWFHDKSLPTLCCNEISHTLSNGMVDDQSKSQRLTTGILAFYKARLPLDSASYEFDRRVQGTMPRASETFRYLPGLNQLQPRFRYLHARSQCRSNEPP